MSFKPHFSRFLAADPDRLHFAAHSHHLWPDVTWDAQQQAWRDAAQLVDDKWDHVFGSVIPAAQGAVARILNLSDPSTIAVAPNTHELVARLVSSLPPPVRILTTDGEFHSFARQIARWQEAGLVEVEQVAVEPFATFSGRFLEAVRDDRHDLIYVSQVFYDSGFLFAGFEQVADAVSSEETVIVVDGYHGFLALPTDLVSIEHRVFYLAGGYKYAMSGEAACFMHCPPGIVPRPINTGWYAGFAQLEEASAGGVSYATGGLRFFGATFDPTALYRFTAVAGLLDELGLTADGIHRHVRRLQDRFLDGLDGPAAKSLTTDMLIPDRAVADRGNFLVFRTPAAGELRARLRALNVIVDHRADRLRIGFGLYHDQEDVDALLERIARV